MKAGKQQQRRKDRKRRTGRLGGRGGAVQQQQQQQALSINALLSKIRKKAVRAFWKRHAARVLAAAQRDK